MPSSPTGNTYELILEASDQASQIVERVKGSLVGTTAAALAAQQQFLLLGTAIATLTTSSLGKLSELNGAVSLLQKTLNTPIGKQLVEGIKEQASEAISETQSLTAILGSIGKTSTPLLEGLVLGDTAGVEAKTKTFASKLSQNILGSVLQGGAGLGNVLSQQLEPALAGIDENFGGIGKVLTDSIRTSLSSDGGGIGEFNGLIGTAASAGLDFGFKEFVKSKLPPGLDLFSDQIAGAVKAVKLPGGAAQLLGGDFFSGLDNLLTDQIDSGLKQAFTEVDAASLGATDKFAALGAALQRNLVEGSNLGETIKGVIDGLTDNIIPQGLAGDAVRLITNPLRDGIAASAQGISAPLRASLLDGLKNLAVGDAFKPIRDGFLSAIGQLDAESGGLLSDVGTRTGGRLGVAFAQGFAGSALAGVGKFANAADALILRTIGSIEKIPGKLTGVFGGIGDAFGGIAGFDEPLGVFKQIQSLSGGLAEGISGVVTEIGRFSVGFEALKQFATNGPFELLIGQNIKLREQLLATQSTLAATNKIVQDGQVIVDPTAAIKGLDAPVKNAVDELRKGSLELVNVTSKDLIESFQIIAGQAGNIGFSLQEAKDLTLSFGAALGTLGVPLAQSRQEITSILTGTIDQNSVVAKSLGLQNEQIQRYKAQGTLVEELTKRLSAFRAGNALAAQTIGGVGSNLQELFDEIGRLAGEQLLDPVVQQLTALYGYINQNKDAIAEGITAAVGELLKAAQAAIKIVQDVFTATQGITTQIPQYLFKSLSNALESLASAVSNTITVLQPAIDVFAELAKNAVALAGPFLAIFLQFKALQIGVGALAGGFGTLAQTLPGVGELLFLLTGRSNGLINTFAGLSGSVGTGAAGFLLLGQNLNSIPGLAGLVAGKLGPLGPLVAGIIPSAAGLGVQILGLTKAFPPLGGVLTGLSGQLPGVISQLAGLAGSSNFAGGAFASLAPSLQQAAAQVSTYTQNTDLATLLNQKFAEATKQAGIAIRNQIIGFGLLAVGVFAAFYAIDNFILKNEAVIEALGGVVSGLQALAGVIKDVVLNPILLTAAAFTTLTIAAFKYSAVLKIIQADQTASLFLGLAGNIGKAGAALQSFGLLTTAGGAAVTAFNASVAAGTVSLGGFAAALAAVALPLVLIVGAIGSIGLYAYSKQLEDSTAATEELGSQSDETANNVLQFASKLKAAKERQDEANRKGIRLSKEEYAANADLQFQSKQRLILLDEEIKKLEEGKKGAVGDNNKNAIQARIDQLTQLKKTVEGLQGGVQIAPLDLPRLGTELEQLANKAKAAEEAIAKSSGDPEVFKNKVKELLDSSEKQLELGLITGEEAKRRAELAINNVNADVETQTQARALLVSAYQDTDKEIQRSYETRQAEIEKATAEGTLTETEAAKQVTAAKLKELDQQLENIRAQQAEELRLNQDGTDKALKEIDRKVAEAKQKLAAASGDKGAVTDLAKKAISDLTPQREAVAVEIANVERDIAAFKDSLKPSDRVGAGKAVADQTIKDAEAKLSTLRGSLDQFDQKLTAQQGALANPNATKDDKAADAARSSLADLAKDRERLQDASNKRAEEINQSARNKEAKNQAEAAKTKAAQEQKEIDRAQKLATQVAEKAEVERQIQVTKLRQGGKLTQIQANEELEKSNQKRIQADIKTEEAKLQALLKNPKRNEDAIAESRIKILQLTKKSLDEEDKLYDAHIAVLREKLEQQSKVYANTVEAQNQKLQQQIQLYDMLEKALQQRNALLNAAKDLAGATSDLLSQELGVLQKGETSERKKKQLAEAIAVVKLETAKQQIELENQITAIQEQQRKIALERREIENDIAIAKKTVEIQKGGNDIQIAREDLKKGKITQADFQGKVLDQSSRQLELQGLLKERGLIGKEKAFQPLLDELERNKRDLNNRKTIRAAESELADAAPTEAKRRKRNRALGEQFAEEFGLTRPQLTQELRDRSAKVVDQTFNKGGKNLPGEDRILTDPKLFPAFNKLQDGIQKAADGITTAKTATLGQVQQDILTRTRGIPQLASPDLKQLSLPQPGQGAIADPARQSQVMEQLLQQMQQQNTPTGSEPGAPGQPAGGMVFNNNFDVTIAAGTNDKSGVTAMKQVVLQGLDDVTRRAQAIAAAKYKIS